MPPVHKIGLCGLKGFARATLEGAVFGVAATWALKTLGPAGGFQRRRALRFGTEALHELGERLPCWN